MLGRFGFVIVDVALKIFFFIFTFQASHVLVRADFDLLSYFRSTLTMCMGALTSTVGLYFLVYARKMHDSPKYGGFYLGIPFGFFTLVLIATFAVLILAAQVLKLDSAIHAIGVWNFFFAIFLASAGQVALVYSKALNRISSETVVRAIVLLSTSVGLGYYLMAVWGLPGAAAYIMLGYGSILLLFPFPKTELIRSRRSPWSRSIMVTLVVFKRFFVPNFLETLFSIVAPWLAVYLLVSNAGMDGIGPVLFYQSLIGLPVFLVYSIVLNDHSLFRHDHSGSPHALSRFRVIYVAFFSLITLVAGGLSPEFKKLLNLSQVSTLTLFALFAASLLQSELIAKGMVFKKANESAKTMKHNVVYSITLCAGSYFLTKSFGVNGYALAVLVAWVVTYIYVNVDFIITFSLRKVAFWPEVLCLSIGFSLLICRNSVHPVVLVLVGLSCISAIVVACRRLMARRFV